MTFGIRQKFGFSGILMLAAIAVLDAQVADEPKKKKK